ncbi:Piwi domain-containing protein [Glomus cerebriforme]|uniref:Piwi domain-containing protein n=1 Tax=Glomus cerebriforme TaxID=658196 RepID=A0A397T347_9GLOM|nr:Piwi domain-containing protein [Glomus cerebriforme]
MSLHELELQMAQRPDLGKEGRRVKLKANYLKVAQFPNISIHQYSFDIVPKVVNKQTISKIYSELAIENGFKNFFTVFDGNSSIYSASPLPLTNERKGNKYKVLLTSHVKWTLGSYEATIKFIDCLSLDRLRNYISSQGPVTSAVITCLAALNAYINFNTRQKYLTAGKGVYPSSLNDRTIILSGGVELKQGFYQSIRPGWGDLFINVDICAAVFYLFGPLPEVICKVFSKRNAEELRAQGVNDHEINILSKYLRNVKVEALHHHNRKPVYRVKRVTKEPANRLMFHNEVENREMSVAEYFYTKYEIKLKFPNLPCVLVNRGIFLPIELCYVLPGQRFEGQLADVTLADMIKHTCVKPQERFRRISKAVSDVFQHNKDPHLKSIGMEVDCNNMVVLNGRVLNPPRLTYNERSRKSEFIPENGRWNIMNKVVCQGAQLINWAVVVFAQERLAPQPLVKTFMKKFREIANQKGMNIPSDPYIMYSNPQGEITTALNIACQKSLFNRDYPPHIIICILGTTGPLYGEIKRIGDTQLGIPTQCILLKRLTKANGIDQICTNIFLKVNAKLGGQNVILSNDQIGFVSSEPTMIFGADVFHSGKGDNKPSIAAVCASMDSKATRYCGRFSVNKDPRNEIIEDLRGIVNDLLRVFYQKNQVLPRKILFYRDGVGENQFQHVLNYEVKALKDVFASIYKNSGPKLTFIILQKRHHTRFMPTESRDGDRLGNCRPGTVVDTTILVRQEFDFFLQSHSSLQGTSRPIHYNVLYDENNFSADGIQTLTYRLCYLSARCTLSISQVPAVYYAHLIANRAKHYYRWEGEEKSDISGSSGKSEISVGSIEEIKNGLANAMFFV